MIVCQANAMCWHTIEQHTSHTQQIQFHLNIIYISITIFASVCILSLFYLQIPYVKISLPITIIARHSIFIMQMGVER